MLNVAGKRFCRIQYFGVFLLLSRFFLACEQAYGADAPKDPRPPPHAFSVGYDQLTFHSRFDEKTIDLQRSHRRGFDWYISRFFGWAPANADDFKFNPDGTITLFGRDVVNGSIATAAPNITGSDWIGTAFGGGAYFEASLKFDPEDHRRADGRGWPSFWSMAIEHMSPRKNEQWKGQPKDYAHFIEADFFEYLLLKGGMPKHYYAGTMHDWYGIWKKTCLKGFCNVSTNWSDKKRRMPVATDFNEFHRYGFLWVPATETSKGYAEWHFDGRPVGTRTTWTLFADQPPPPDNAPWKFGIIDRQHLVLILGTGEEQPMTVEYVVVWQATADHNLKQ